VVGGLIALVVVLAAASAAGFAMRQRQGRFRDAGSKSTPLVAAGAADTGQSPSSGSVQSSPGGATPRTPRLSAKDLGAPLGTQATLVQFSTEVCAYCGPTRKLLTEVARERDGIAFVEIDAAERMDLTRRLRVLSTPTVLVLDALGGVTSRASGPMRKADVLSAVGQVLHAGGGTS
jgi:thiol-disulfide isomerase/thioredoxin